MWAGHPFFHLVTSSLAAQLLRQEHNYNSIHFLTVVSNDNSLSLRNIFNNSFAWLDHLSLPSGKVYWEILFFKLYTLNWTRSLVSDNIEIKSWMEVRWHSIMCSESSWRWHPFPEFLKQVLLLMTKGVSCIFAINTYIGHRFGKFLLIFWLCLGFCLHFVIHYCNPFYNWKKPLLPC